MVAVERVKSGSKYEDLFKFSRLVKVGNWVYSSNTAGRNYQTREISPDVRKQAHQALDNLSGALAGVGARLSDTVRFHISVATREDLEPVLEVIAERVGGNDPAHTIAIGTQPHEEMKLELAVIAYIRDPDTPDVVTRVTV
ncbi:Enamine deaminase RidA, house cleaning of reactive enamine intermediates, YjgF/YER057c/UK114 family [Devosia enhydra]|uniref:Enamine deaminase RidA, house cleaning of reactive enamine intermediates, YjgF/YER057c/UK114 family n=1 Tax=Devosia enhydra TaxID=665118 RepID=A0A1K2I0M0_9HYPH|nr:Rid family hydrolase [Devosia enhydra]SFZ85918.1 Enamine deaminase RidA, house cleaning of reactive enamine intermediates, YjgF/YER057c/UK114 family [Devosia enhydra]